MLEKLQQKYQMHINRRIVEKQSKLYRKQMRDKIIQEIKDKFQFTDPLTKQSDQSFPRVDDKEEVISDTSPSAT